MFTAEACSNMNAKPQPSQGFCAMTQEYGYNRYKSKSIMCKSLSVAFNQQIEFSSHNIMQDIPLPTIWNGLNGLCLPGWCVDAEWEVQDDPCLRIMSLTMTWESYDAHDLPTNCPLVEIIPTCFASCDQLRKTLWRFPKTGGTPKWMVYNGKS